LISASISKKSGRRWEKRTRPRKSERSCAALSMIVC
jgi:hypothetical protein